MGWRMHCLHLQIQVQAQRAVQPCLSVLKKAVQLLHCSRILGNKQKKTLTFSLALESRLPMWKQSGAGVLLRLSPAGTQHCQGAGSPEYMSSAALRKEAHSGKQQKWSWRPIILDFITRGCCFSVNFPPLSEMHYPIECKQYWENCWLHAFRL